MSARAAFARRTGRLASGALLLVLAALAALLLVPAAMGLQRYVIVSGSMTGTYDRGSLVLDEVVPVSQLAVGDVITYRPPAGAGPGGLVTHRIASIARERGRLVFRTKGDANAARDPWTFSLARPRQARVRAGIPYAGFALAALSRRQLRMLLVGVPAALIALVSLAGLWRETAPPPAPVPR